MTSEKPFCCRYVRYSEIPDIRKAHDSAFRVFNSWFKGGPGKANVIGLGCNAGEYQAYGSYGSFLCIGKCCCLRHGPRIQADYLNPAFLTHLRGRPEAIVSIFDIEPRLPRDRCYKLYERLFRGIPSLEYVLSSGFYYLSRVEHERVIGTGGFTGHQTIENAEDYPRPGFEERRYSVEMPPSEFGPDIIEVWKLLRRRH